MKAKTVVVLGLLSTAVGGFVGCQSNQSSASATPNMVSSPPKSTTPGWEYKTVEKNLSEVELRKQIGEWSEQGWAVLNVSAPIQQADGTVHRKINLGRAQQ